MSPRGQPSQALHFSPNEDKEMQGIWTMERLLCVMIPGELEVVDGMPEDGKIQLVGVPSVFTPDQAPEEMFEIAQ